MAPPRNAFVHDGRSAGQAGAPRLLHCAAVVHVASDVTALLQRREVLAWEQRVARSAYAYGVDLRRAQWLDNSTFGEPIMRAVDRKWNALVADLSGSILQDASRTAPLALMEEIARIARLLRAPMPTLRLLVRGLAPQRWPCITPLGTTKGAMHWLVVDPDLLTALPAHERSFLIGSALADLQCDHGPVYSAHLMTDRAQRGNGLVRLLLRPWAYVGAFSADRGGLIACGDLAAATSALRVHADSDVPWLPARPPLSHREAALADFDRSTTMTRLRILLERHRASVHELSVLESRTPEPSPEPTTEAQRDDAPTGADRDPYRRPANADAPKAPERDEEMERALSGAWSLARCDARLTRRLGLL